MDHILYGAAYYDEYMPCDRLDKDIAMMKKAGINVIRIAESTWSTEEPEEGVFDFSHVTRVLDKCEENGISVIVGTPTYAIPAWMAKSYPEVMVTQNGHRRPYGARQIMDITHPAYRFYAERIIRRLMEAVSGYRCVIGYQVDNETKHFGTSSENVQRMFVRHMRQKYHGDIEQLNRDFGLDYWSNAIHAWEDFPSVTGTINGSLRCAFEEFSRSLVTDFLARQAEIVREYLREDQFITHNFDFGWYGHSYGVQPDVDHFKACKALTIAGCDIYHPSQDRLTGREIAFCGDLTRSLKKDNYLVIETEAQGFPEWTPYPGQLRLQAYSHLASGADSVMYWHWHSIHNACETYWKGILSHDFEENAVYHEACVTGNEFKQYGAHLLHLKKRNKAAILVSNEALSAIECFPIPGNLRYNHVVRSLYDALYRNNIECDILSPDDDFSPYTLLLVPALYAASDGTIEKIRLFAENGGWVLSTFKTAFTDENVKVRHEVQPYHLTDLFGVRYHLFTAANGTKVIAADGAKETPAIGFMELLEADSGTTVHARYTGEWADYAAVTEHVFGKGRGIYVGTFLEEEAMVALMRYIARSCGLWSEKNECPLTVREGINANGEAVTYYLNYSPEEKTVSALSDGVELFTQKAYKKGEPLTVARWNLTILLGRNERNAAF